MGFGSAAKFEKFANFLVKNQEFQKSWGLQNTGANCNWGSDERLESLKKGVLTAGHRPTRIALPVSAPEGSLNRYALFSIRHMVNVQLFCVAIGSFSDKVFNFAISLSPICLR